MRVILYPDKQIVYTYLQIGCDVKLIISKDGEQVVLCPDNIMDQLNDYLSENSFLPIDSTNDFILFLNKEEAEWEFNCPKHYKGLLTLQEQQKAYYYNGISTIAKALAHLQCFTNIRLKKGNLLNELDIFYYLEMQ